MFSSCQVNCTVEFSPLASSMSSFSSHRLCIVMTSQTKKKPPLIKNVQCCLQFEVSYQQFSQTFLLQWWSSGKNVYGWSGIFSRNSASDHWSKMDASLNSSILNLRPVRTVLSSMQLHTPVGAFRWLSAVLAWRYWAAQIVQVFYFENCPAEKSTEVSTKCTQSTASKSTHCWLIHCLLAIKTSYFRSYHNIWSYVCKIYN